MNWYKISKWIPLQEKLEQLKPEMVRVAQEIYDGWDQDGDGVDIEYGCGGICDQISNAIGDLIVGAIDNSDSIPGGQDGDDHAWVIAKVGNEAFGVDIPPGFYETGSGYCWKKIPDVIFIEDMIDIYPINIEDLEEWDELV